MQVDDVVAVAAEEFADALGYGEAGGGHSDERGSDGGPGEFDSARMGRGVEVGEGQGVRPVRRAW
jgi:hypothetical protein